MTDGSARETLAVLLVEDVPLQRMAAAAVLREAGLRVVEAGTVAAAIAALDAEPPLDVLVADIDLAGEPLTGLTLAKAVAARWPEMALLLISGMIRPDPDALPQGARFLPKPFDPDVLAGAVREVAAARAAGTLGPGDPGMV